MKQNNKKKNTFVAENACGSHFFCNLHPISEKASIGEMLEWLKRHAWKACIPLKGIRGSNPRLSACLLYTSPSPRDCSTSRMPSSA